MSVWYSVEGSVVISRFSRCSLYTVLRDSMGVEGGINILRESVTCNSFKYSVSWSNTLDGIDAALEIKKFVKILKDYDNNVRYDLISELRFLN